MVNRTFSSSMEVGVRVEAENMRTGARRHCCSAYLTFVSLKGKAKQQQQQQQQQLTAQQQQQQQQQQPLKHGLPRVLPTSSEHRRIHTQAEARRQQRLAARQAAAADPQRAAAAAACRLQPITHRWVVVNCCTYSHVVT
jgi:acyl-CoA hydrolase